MFIWSSIAHMVLPLGEAGLSEIPDEPAVLSVLRSSLGDNPGLYIFPGLGAGPNATRQQMHEAMARQPEKVANNPSGLLMYHPPGRPFTMVRWLGVECLTEVAETFLVALLLSYTVIASYAGRVGFFFLAGILAAISTNISYWNWYGFPTTYTAAYMVTQVIGFLCAGLVAAWILGRRTRLVSELGAAY